MGTTTTAFNSNRRFERLPDSVFENLKVMSHEGRHAEVIACAKHYIPQYPHNSVLYAKAAAAFSKLGEGAQERGDMKSAGSYWESSMQYALAGLKVRNSDMVLLCHVGKTFRQMGDFENGEAFFLRALRINDSDKHAWTGLGELLLRWAQDGENVTDDEYNSLMNEAALCVAKAYALDPTDMKTCERMSELAEYGYTADSGDEYDLEDPALEVINDEEARNPADLPDLEMLGNSKAAPTLDRK